MANPLNSKRLKKTQLAIFSVALTVLLGLVGYALYHNSSAAKLREAAQSSNYRAPSTPYKTTYQTPGRAVDTKEAWISQSEAELKAMKEDNKTLRDNVGQLKDQVVSLQGMLSQVLNKTKELQAKATASPAFGQTGATPNTATPATLSNNPGLSLSKLAPPKAAQKPKIAEVTFRYDDKDRKHIRDTIPAGTYMKAVLLNGLDAPTGGRGDSMPVPVFLQVLNKAELPNRFEQQTRECRFVTSGRGSLAEERAYLRTTTLSCVLRNGDIISKKVKGQVMGPDGKVGIHGLVKSKQGAYIARSILAGTFGSFGKALSQTYQQLSTSPLGTVQSIDPTKQAKYSLGQGIGTAFEKVADWYLKRADELYPVINVDGGIIVDVAIQDDVDLGANLLDQYRPPKSEDTAQ